MTDEQKDRILADCLEDYHREKARGEVSDLAAYREKLGDLYDEFLELVAAETAIDEALEPMADVPLPIAWGEYTLLREIARGAAGVVYEALHRKLGRKVALKVLRTGVDVDDTARERFRREAQALAQIRHDHIVEIYEFGEVDGRPFYAMTLVEGPTLAELAKRDERPEPRELCAGLAGIANALQALHDARIIHRDVKPSNIMIGPDGRYVLADFGLARTALSTTMTRSGDALGTPLYMSPEQMLGNRDGIEARTDVYGLGATLYQLLTGVPPFKTDNLHALMRMVLQQRPDTPRSVNTSLPNGCSRIAMKCLEKEPRDRYATATALEDDLRAFAEGKRVSGKPLTAWRRGGRNVRRHPVMAVAAMLVVAFGAFMLLRPPPPPPPPENATLMLKAWPNTIKAEARINDGEWQSLPFENGDAALKPNIPHKLAVRAKGVYGFGIWEMAYTFKPSQSHTEVAILPVVDPDSEDVLKAYAEIAKIAYSSDSKRLQRVRSQPREIDIELWFPRGTVRVADLDTWQVAVGELFPLESEKGWIEFSIGGEVVARTRFPADPEISESGAIPALVRERAAKLGTGDLLRWGYRSDTRDYEVYEDLKISRVDLAKDLQRIDNHTTAKKGVALTPAAKRSLRILRTNLRSQYLLAQDLAYAAYREARSLVEPSDPKDPKGPKQRIETMRLLDIQKQALEKMYAKRTERIESGPWSELVEGFERFPRSEYKRFYGTYED